MSMTTVNTTSPRQQGQATHIQQKLKVVGEAGVESAGAGRRGGRAVGWICVCSVLRRILRRSLALAAPRALGWPLDGRRILQRVRGAR